MTILNSDFFELLGWLLLALLIMPLVCEFLDGRLGPKGNQVVRNVSERVKEWWVVIVVLSIAVALGTFGIMALFVFCSFATLREFLTLTNTKLADSWALSAAFFFVLPFQYLAVGMGWQELMQLFVPVYVFLGLPVLSALRGVPHSFLIRVAETQWSLMICVYCLSHVPALLTLDIAGFNSKNLLLILYLVIVVQSADTLQYIWSKAIGRRRIARSLSPSKTLEGLVLGVLSSCVVGGLLSFITPFGFIGSALMAGFLALIGFCGSLVMAAIKRDRGIKEWGPMVLQQAQGGFIDRLDSVIFAAPVFYHLVRFGWG
ncbi:MAG: phosphatidate cytidylyltransferase [Planktomarina sp.]